MTREPIICKLNLANIDIFVNLKTRDKVPDNAIKMLV